MTATSSSRVPTGPQAEDTTVDLLIVGSGTGLATALSAWEQGLSCLVVEKTEYVGGSTALSGGAFWVPGNHVLRRSGFPDTVERGRQYLENLVDADVPRERWEAFLTHGPAAIEMLERTTGMRFFWSRGYADYHPELPGGAAIGRTCEAAPVDLAGLGAERARFRPSSIKAPVPMPITGADYKWMNLMARTPARALPRVARRMAQGIGGMLLKREYAGTGQATAGGLFRGAIAAGIPIWTRARLTALRTDAGRVVGAEVEQDGRAVTITARRGVVLSAGGFDHNADWRRRHSPALTEERSLGSPGNVGDTIALAQQLGAATGFMDQAWWFPSMHPVAAGGPPKIMLAERSLPGSFLVDETGTRFVNESMDYMSFGQHVMDLRARGRAHDIWLVFDQQYRKSYVLASELMPGMAIPQAWYDAGVAVSADTPADLARAMGVPDAPFADEIGAFNRDAAAGIDSAFGRGNSAYDRYYGDPTVQPNPNLRPLSGRLHAVKVVLADLGTCGGLMTDATGHVVDDAGAPIPGLYAQGNNAANVFGRTYPGAGATIAGGLVFGHIIATDAARGE